MNKINVMYIFNDINFGGAGQSLLDTLNEIKQYINPIIIVRKDSDVEKKFRLLDIQCYKIEFTTDYVKKGESNEEKRRLDAWRNYKAALKLIPIIEKEKIELIHINSSVSYFGAIAALMSNVPYIWHIRELIDEQFGCESLNEELKVKLYKRADKVITISNYVYKKFKKKYDIDTMKLYNGLDIKRFKNSIKEIKKYTNIFLVAGMMLPGKRQWDVICATEILVKKGYSDIKVIIVGDGERGYIWALKKYAIKKNLQKNIYIISFQDDLSTLRKQVSYAITSSQNEALGRVTIESMLAGNIVIGARSGGTTEIIGMNEERGFLYDLGNCRELANVMIKVMHTSPEIKNLIAKNAQIYAETVFDSKIYSKKLLKLYNEIITSYIAKDNTSFLHKLYIDFSLNKNIEYYFTEYNTTLLKKCNAAFELLAKWMEIKQNGYFIQDYFKQHNIYNIAIYGMAEIGRRLYDELEESKIDVKYLIDKNPNGMEKILKFTSLENDKLNVDAIVVTVVLSELEVINEIKKKGYQNVMGLNEIINSIMDKHILKNV